MVHTPGIPHESNKAVFPYAIRVIRVIRGSGEA
jgi:hypothetical protein